jgi:hypothetical protein
MRPDMQKIWNPCGQIFVPITEQMKKFVDFRNDGSSRKASMQNMVSLIRRALPFLGKSRDVGRCMRIHSP